MTTLRLVEHGTTQAVPLAPDQVRDLQAAGIVASAVPGLLPGTWDLTAAARVGAVRIGVLDVVIDPKLPVHRVLHLLGLSGQADVFRHADIDLADSAGLVDVMATLLARLADRALAAGVLQGYRAHEESSMVVRGRIDLAAQLRRRHGIPLPVEVRYDEFDTDIPENQVLRAACRRMLLAPGIHPRARHGLAAVTRRLGDVADLVPGVPPPAWRPTRLNQRYVPALRVADLVLAAASVDLGHGTTPVPGFLVDLARVFEGLLEAHLAPRLAARGGRCGAQRQWPLDDQARATIRPDLVWFGAGGVPRAVIDAKYKGGSLPNADLYQLIAYCTRLGLTDGHLVSAAGERPVATRTMLVSGLRVHEHSLALDADAQQLEAGLDRLAVAIASRARPRPPDTL